MIIIMYYYMYYNYLKKHHTCIKLKLFEGTSKYLHCLCQSQPARAACLACLLHICLAADAQVDLRETLLCHLDVHTETVKKRGDISHTMEPKHPVHITSTGNSN